MTRSSRSDADRLQQIETAIASMDALDRALFLSVRLDSLSYMEVARLYDVPVERVEAAVVTTLTRIGQLRSMEATPWRRLWQRWRAYWLKLEDRLNRELAIDKTLHTPVNFIVHTLQEVNDGLAQGRYFFMDVAKDGIAWRWQGCCSPSPSAALSPPWLKMMVTDYVFDVATADAQPTVTAGARADQHAHPRCLPLHRDQSQHPLSADRAR